MNRSFSKIRHIQEANRRLEKRLFNEQVNDNDYMELVPGQTYKFFPVFPEEDKLRINLETVKNNNLEMKILSYGNKVLEGMVDQTKKYYNEFFLTPKNNPPQTQRYFCEKDNSKNCIVDSDLGYTKLMKKNANASISNLMKSLVSLEGNSSKDSGYILKPDKSQSLFSKVTDDNFDSLVMESKVPFIVRLTAAWCLHCPRVAVILSEIKTEYGDKFNMGELDVGVEKIKAEELKVKYEIPSIPAILIFKNKEMVKKIIGGKSKEEYKEEIDGIL